MTRKPLHALVCSCLVVLALSFAPPAGAADAVPPDKHLEQGLKALERGAFDDAVVSLSEAARLYERSRQPTAQVAALMPLARAYAALGQYRQAIKTLEAALELTKKSGGRGRMAAVLADLGNAHIAIGSWPAAEGYLTNSLSLARRLGDSALAAAILNDLGNLSAMNKKYPEAIAAYRESIVLAKRAGHRPLTARALTNAAGALRVNGEPQEAETSLDAAFDLLRQLDPSHDTAFGLTTVGLAYRDLRPALPSSSARLSLRGSDALNQAAAVAETLGDRRTASYAWGYLGGLYEDEGRYAEALQLTRKAIFAAQQVNAPESLYRWQWQAGRLLKKLGTVDDALAAYRRAVLTLQSIRPELSATYGGLQTSFRESVGPVYFELVDLLLQRAASLPNRDQVGAYLVEAREAVELLKAAELRDYFRDDCVDTLLSKTTSLDVVSRTAVVVYPILLPDRTELLVSLPTGLKRFSVPVGAAALTREVRELRRKLEKRTTREYLPHAQRLYEWLVRPLEADLTSLRIDTLVFVPDGPLRTIPVGALHDGKQFLVEKYALAITPGLSLTDPRPINRQGLKVLAVGVTEPVQGFPPLPNVSVELDALRSLFGSTNLLNQDFVVSRLEKELKDERFTIVHVASHGHFGGDVRDTFLLAFDDKLTIDRLDQLVGVFKFRDDPLDLLTLSACDTAAGDDRAALGLAGVAVKAGARSAVATLWDINDRVSADLVAEFYRELGNPSISRASALRRAQMKILADPRYEHPGFWSPFLLINNWL
ncbi:MAG TPA: CHAT domain-containing protein [Methylomirabilota bacterium]|jgi:CHAT domain-containing protein/Tfp pilus assembly protein PilF|nr:CHAT domain-containing protein [Methylomirabilota bacterium]